MLKFSLPLAALISSVSSTPVVSGSGNFRYQYDPAKLKLPASVQLLNGHGLTRDKAGNIYFTYESTNKDDPGVRALIRFQPDGTGGTLLGDASLAQGVPHGIKIAEEDDGTEYLYHGNNAAKVHKTTLDGKYIWTTDMTDVWSRNKTHWPFKPTDVLVPPGETAVFVADGYGLSKVHEFDTQTGNYTGVVFGGKGTGNAPIQFNCDHGISFDDRIGKIVVSDRSNHRLRWIDDDGTLVKDLNLTLEVPLPCNAQTSSGTVLGGDYLIVPGLGLDFADPGPWLNGTVGIYDINNTLVSNIEVAKHLGVGVLGHTHPHDAIFLRNGDIAVAIWKGHEAGSVGGLEYWTRLPNNGTEDGTDGGSN
eukprot:m.1032799 g.1032799  ORF g.1032799 m.1032799 type:complete len:362 (-) comp24127_c0_seq6:236-1321(-)